MLLLVSLYGVLLSLGLILFFSLYNAAKVTLLHLLPKHDERLDHHQQTRNVLFIRKFKVFNSGAYKIVRRFWNDYFAKRPYLVLEGEKSTAINNLLLPKDVLLEILARLPVKSLLRLRSVSKSWRDIMKEPTFITEHHLSQVALNNGNCVFARFNIEDRPERDYFGLLEKDQQGGIKCTRLELPFPKDSYKRQLKVAGLCNGIVVISDGNDELFLWNPATREYKAFPPSQASALADTDTTYRWCCVGFGIDPITKDYKVVRLWHFYFDEDLISIDPVEVISLSASNLCRPKSDTWNIIDAYPPIHIAAFKLDHIYANGKCYWYDANPIDIKCRIAWFDMGAEVFGTIELPNLCCDTSYERLVVLKGSVVVIRHASIVENKYMYELLIIDDGPLRKYATVGPFMPSERPMGLWKNQELIMLADATTCLCSDIIFYDISTNVMKSKMEGLIRDQYPESKAFDLFNVYNESLISFY